MADADPPGLCRHAETPGAARATALVNRGMSHRRLLGNLGNRSNHVATRAPQGDHACCLLRWRLDATPSDGDGTVTKHLSLLALLPGEPGGPTQAGPDAADLAAHVLS